MGDMGEYWNDVKPHLKEKSRARRAANRVHGESELLIRRVPFLKKNHGAHLIVYPEDAIRRIDYWPGTGLWRSYFGAREGRGIKSLLSFLRVDQQENAP